MYKATHKGTGSTHTVDEAGMKALKRVTRSYSFLEIPEPKEAKRVEKEEPKSKKKKLEEPEEEPKQIEEEIKQ